MWLLGTLTHAWPFAGIRWQNQLFLFCIFFFFLPLEGQGEDKVPFPQASHQPALSMHLKRRRIHFRVLKLNPGGEELHHAKQSISFSVESYITDPPFPPDRMTYVIYHMGPSQTTGRGGKPSPCDVSPPPLSTVPLACRRALLIWREGGESRGRGEERRKPASYDGWLGVWRGRREIGRGTEEVMFFHIICWAALFSLWCSSERPPPLALPLFPSFFPLVVKEKKKLGLTGIIQATLACEGWYKWISELLASHDSNMRYLRWMFLKKRLMVDAGLRVPFIILNII